MYRISCKFNLRSSKWTKTYHKSNNFNFAYQQRIQEVFFFNSKLNDSVEWNKRAGGGIADKTDNRKVSYKHRTEMILVQIK